MTYGCKKNSIDLNVLCILSCMYVSWLGVYVYVKVCICNDDVVYMAEHELLDVEYPVVSWGKI